MRDLWDEFPKLQPSAIRKVLDSLAKKELVASAGDLDQVYLGGVHWWSTAFGVAETDEVIAEIAGEIEEAQLPIEASIDLQERAMTLYIPVSELESILGGRESRAISELGACLARLWDRGCRPTLAVDRIMVGPVPRLVVKLIPAR